MTIESLIGIISGVVTIGLAVPVIYGHVKKQPLTELMNQLVDKNMTTEQHRKTLKKMNRRLVEYSIKKDYIQKFVLNDRKKKMYLKIFAYKTILNRPKQSAQNLWVMI